MRMPGRVPGQGKRILNTPLPPQKKALGGVFGGCSQGCPARGSGGEIFGVKPSRSGEIEFLGTTFPSFPSAGILPRDFFSLSEGSEGKVETQLLSQLPCPPFPTRSPGCRRGTPAKKEKFTGFLPFLTGTAPALAWVLPELQCEKSFETSIFFPPLSLFFSFFPLIFYLLEEEEEGGG